MRWKLPWPKPAALKLAELGRPVKMMLGGLTGWEDESYAFASGD